MKANDSRERSANVIQIYVTKIQVYQTGISLNSEVDIKKIIIITLLDTCSPISKLRE